MTLIQETIASSGGDYTSLSAAEASIPGSSADDFEFTYIEGFTDTTQVTFNPASFTGTCKVFVQEAYQCKGAVTGAHAELHVSVTANSSSINATSPKFEVHDLRVIRSGSTGAGGTAILIAGANCKVNRCTLINSSSNGVETLYLTGASAIATNNFIIRRNPLSTRRVVAFETDAGIKFYRNTVLLVEGTVDAMCVVAGAACLPDLRENVFVFAAGCTLTNGVFTTISGGAYNAACEYNVGGDTSTPGTNATDNAAAEDYLTTLTEGSEDLHYISRAVMIALSEGADLSATTGTTDIDGNTIGGWYPGADYVPSANDRFVAEGSAFFTAGGQLVVT